MTLKKRSEFLRTRGGARWASPTAVIEMKPRGTTAASDAKPAAGTQPRARPTLPAASAGPPRFGFTVTKKLGNAVVRNRIRRRLKAAITRLIAEGRAKDGCDYVLIARPVAQTRPFAVILADLGEALRRVHTGPERVKPKGRSEPRP